MDGSLDIEIEQKLADMGLELPLPTVPRANLRRFTVEGADMVDYSGGKSIRGPQSTPVLWGRADLTEAAAANPNRFIGRGMKVAKEEIIGLLHAVQILVDEDKPAENRRYEQMCRRVVDVLTQVPGLRVTLEHDKFDYLIPHAAIHFAREARSQPRPNIRGYEYVRTAYISPQLGKSPWPGSGLTKSGRRRTGDCDPSAA